MNKPCTTVLALAFLAVGLLQGQTSGWRQYAIVDPVLQMPAWNVAVPSDWKAEGTMMTGGSCGPETTPVFKVTTPDGTAGWYFLPRTNWAWGAGMRPNSDCLPFNGPVSAKNYLTDLARIEGVGIVRQLPTQAYTAPPNATISHAQYLVRYSVAGRPVDEVLDGSVGCSTLSALGIGEQHKCYALVSRFFAPSGKLDALMPTFRRMKMSLDQQWWAAWQAAMVMHTRQLYAAETQRALEQGRLAGAQRMQAHDAFMTSFEQQGAARATRFREGEFQKQRQSDNFVDYVLDCQRVYSGGNRASVGNNCPNRQTF